MIDSQPSNASLEQKVDTDMRDEEDIVRLDGTSSTEKKNKCISTK